MPAELMDFESFVGTYSITPGTPESPRHKYGSLKQTGPAKLISVNRKTLEYSVGLLLKTNVRDLDAEGISKLERNVLHISRRIGMLLRKRDHLASRPEDGRVRLGARAAPEVGQGEPLTVWIKTAEAIQAIFSFGHDLESGGSVQMDMGDFVIRISLRPGDTPSIRFRPSDAQGALFYSAAQMISRGMTGHACDNCGTPFVGGGERSRNKKRAGSRFCSDVCRYNFHNAKRRKRKL